MSKSQERAILTRYTIDLGTLNEITLTINLALTHKVNYKNNEKIFINLNEEINGLDTSFNCQPLWNIHMCESYPHRLEGFPKINC